MSNIVLTAIGRRAIEAASEWIGWDIDGNAFRVTGDPLRSQAAAGEVVDGFGVLLAPVKPPKIVAAAVNYVSHAIRRDPPEKPELFYKPVTSVIGPDQEIVFPSDADIVEAEGEIVLVIGRDAKNLTVEEAEGAILGYTAGFDISARNYQRGDRHFWRAKGCDTFSPIGPRIRLGAPPPDTSLATFVNGEEKQSTTVGDMLFSPAELLSFASRYISFEPGDLFYTGTPGVPPGVVSGDAIEVRVDGVGSLQERVA